MFNLNRIQVNRYNFAPLIFMFSDVYNKLLNENAKKNLFKDNYDINGKYVSIVCCSAHYINILPLENETFFF